MTSITITHTNSVSCQTLTATTSNIANLVMPGPTTLPATPTAGNSVMYAPNTDSITFLYSNGNTVNFSLGGGVNGLYQPPTASGTLVSANATQTLTNKNISAQNSNVISATLIRGIPIANTVPTNDQNLFYNGTQWIPSGPVTQIRPFFWVFNQNAASNVNGPNLTTGFNIRPITLNTAESSTSTNVTQPAANQIGFSPGVYRVQAVSSLRSNTASETRNSQLLLSLAGTPGTIYIYGQSVRCNVVNTNGSLIMTLMGIVSFNTATNCNIYHALRQNFPNGTGLASGAGLETYLTVYIEQL